jgi:tRNA/tmRNA/rRNA uracil-C5-methylase (TrmA/RlmC/RlmD family)
MAEETLTEALANLNDENIEKASLPENRRVEEETSEEVAIIDLDEEDVQEIEPITEDVVKEDFDAKPIDEEEEISEAERRTRTSQDRINKAVAQAKEFQRRELQALQYVKELQEQNKELSGQLLSSQQSSSQENMRLQEGYRDEFETRVETQAQAAKNAYKTAYESGDPDRMADAQQLIAQAEADRAALNKYKQDYEEYKVKYQEWLEDQQASQEQSFEELQRDQGLTNPVYGQPQNQPVYQEPSAKAQEWAEKNEWFGTDQAMTDQVMAIHKRLAATQIDLESDKYYSEIDKQMREAFPHRFDIAGDETNVQKVVSGSRTTGTGRNQNNRRIELSPSEQQLAKRLGVPFKEYAKQKMRLQRS